MRTSVLRSTKRNNNNNNGRCEPWVVIRLYHVVLRRYLLLPFVRPIMTTMMTMTITRGTTRMGMRRTTTTTILM